MIHFSIVIPTRNRVGELSRIITELSNLNYPKKNYEVLIVNNGGKEIKSINRLKRNRPRLNIRVINEKTLGPSFARNRGIENAKFKYIVCLDDDISIKKDLLKQYSLLISKFPDLALAAGKVVATSLNKNGLKFYKRILGSDSWVFSESVQKKDDLTILKFPDDLISANILINLIKVKKPVFDNKFGTYYRGFYVGAEDSDLVMRLLLEEKKVIYNPSIVSWHWIGTEKLNLRFILGRFFRAGVEQRMLDRKFKGKRGYHTYRFRFRNPIKEVLFLAGYYFFIKDR